VQSSVLFLPASHPARCPAYFWLEQQFGNLFAKIFLTLGEVFLTLGTSIKSQCCPCSVTTQLLCHKLSNCCTYIPILTLVRSYRTSMLQPPIIRQRAPPCMNLPEACAVLLLGCHLQHVCARGFLTLMVPCHASAPPDGQSDRAHGWTCLACTHVPCLDVRHGSAAYKALPFPQPDG